MKAPICIVGLGELGSVFARGFMRLGHPVFPILRGESMDQVARAVDPELVLISTGEGDLQTALKSLPEVWKDRIVMIQNELLPRDWSSHALINPTVISVWFEKKKGMDSKPVISSPAFGPHAQTLVDALAQLDIPAHTVDSEQALLNELVIKNVYILTTNIAGLKLPEGATVETLENEHADWMNAVAEDVLNIQEALTGQELNREQMINGMKHAFAGDPDHKCMGRSAPARLARALKTAEDKGISIPTLNSISND